MMRALLALLVLIAADSARADPQTCDTATTPPIPAIKGLVYEKARALVVAAGWVPTHGSQYDDMASNQNFFHARGYTEVQFCAVDVNTPCRMDFISKGVLLRVTTWGEENALLDTHAVVKKIELACGLEP